MDKAVILARGLGTRMRRPDAQAQIDSGQAAAAETGVKAMIPIGRPFLDYVLSGLADCGYQRVCLVVAPDHDVFRQHYEKDVSVQRLQIDFAVQPEPKGTADAVSAARDFAADDPFLVINSDGYYPTEALSGLRLMSGCGTALFERTSMIDQGNVPADRVRQFAVAKINEQGLLQEILEKPDETKLAAMGNEVWVSMNCWRFGPSIFEACREIRPSSRGELELPDAVQYAIDRLGETFEVLKVREPVFDMTNRGDIAAIAERLSGLEVRL